MSVPAWQIFISLVLAPVLALLFLGAVARARTRITLALLPAISALSAWAGMPSLAYWTGLVGIVDMIYFLMIAGADPYTLLKLNPLTAVWMAGNPNPRKTRSDDQERTLKNLDIRQKLFAAALVVALVVYVASFATDRLRLGVGALGSATAVTFAGVAPLSKKYTAAYTTCFGCKSKS